MTILVATFTYGGDEEIAKYNTVAVGTLREAYPEHKIVHYLIDDANHPFKEPFKDEGDTHYIQSNFDRNGNLNGLSSLIGITQELDNLAQTTGADWIIKLDSDSVIMSLDFLNPEYDYIGSNGYDEPKIYARGWCATYKPQVIHEVRKLLENEENINKVILAKNDKGYANAMGEDVLFGAAIVEVLGKKSFIGNLNENMQLSFFYDDSQTLNPNAACVLCKLYGKEPEPIIERMKKATELIKKRVQKSKKTNSILKTTILVATFTQGEDEETAKFGAKAIQTLREVYPEHKIVHYLIDDANNPFKKPFKDDGDTHYIQTSFQRHGMYFNKETFAGKIATIKTLADETKADWIINAEADVILMRLDFLNPRFDYIGSKGAEENGIEYVWGKCCAFKPWIIHEIWEKISETENFDKLVSFFDFHENKSSEDFAFGCLTNNTIGGKMLSGTVNNNDNLCSIISDSAPLNPTAFAAFCKGRYMKGSENNHIAFVGDKNMLSSESVLNRMKKIYPTLQRKAERKTIAITTFTYDQDEEIALLTAKSVDELRKLYPHYKIFHYIIVDGNHPFKGKYEDTEETFFFSSTFKRNGNLCGISAFEGVVHHMDRVEKMSNADWVIKMDSDTVILSLDSLNSGYDFMGTTMCEEQKWCGGACLIFTGDAIKAIGKLVGNRGVKYEQFLNLARAEGYPSVDDSLMSAAAIEYLGFRCKRGLMYDFENTTIFWKDDWKFENDVRAVVCKPQKLDEYSKELEVPSIAGRIEKVSKILRKRLEK